MLNEDFIPVAIDQWYQRSQGDAEGEFFQKIASQGPRKDMSQTTQGSYVASADGVLLGYNNNFGAQRLRNLMRGAVARKRDWSAEPIEDFRPDSGYQHGIPEGAIVVQVNSKVLSGYAKPRSRHHLIKQQSIGRDNMWILPAEIDALKRGQFPESLATKLARFHLVDNTRGEPPMWSEQDRVALEIEMDDEGLVSGKVEFRTTDGTRSYSAEILGVIDVVDGNVERFDLVAKGMHEGMGKWNPGAPGKAFPLAIAFRLAQEEDFAYKVRPQPLKAYGRGYLDFGK